MRINLLTSFAAGILISTSISGAVYFSDKSEVSKASVSTTDNQVKGQLSEKEMKNKLATKGYVVQTKAEYDKNIKDAKAAASAQKDAQPAANAQAQQTVTRVIVNVAEGMTSYNVGQALLDGHLIQNDAFSFSKDIEARGLENKLRPGSYTVDSSMSYDQILSIIFNG